MKITPINNTFNNYRTSAVSFKHSAVPYPEYESAYNVQGNSFDSAISNLVSKISTLFSPKVTQEAGKIKKEIDGLYSQPQNNKHTRKQVQQRLVSVLA